MRKCLRCNAVMVEGLEIKTNDALGLTIGQKGLFKAPIGKLIGAACPECGYVETYIENTEKLKSTIC